MFMNPNAEQTTYPDVPPQYTKGDPANVYDEESNPELTEEERADQIREFAKRYHRKKKAT